MDESQSFHVSKEVESDIAFVRAHPMEFLSDGWQGQAYELVCALLRNSVDELSCKDDGLVSVTLHRDFSVTVEDNGGGIAVAPHPELSQETGRAVSILEALATNRAFAAGFEQKKYKTFCEGKDVGLAVVNCLSEWFEIESRREQGVFRQSFRKGIPTGPLQRVGDAEPPGTTIRFRLDDRLIFPIKTRSKSVESRLRVLSIATESVCFEFRDEVTGRKSTFDIRSGFEEVGQMARTFKPLKGERRVWVHPDIVQCVGCEKEIEYEIAFQYTNGWSSDTTYINGCSTSARLPIHRSIASMLDRFMEEVSHVPLVKPRERDFSNGLLFVAILRFSNMNRLPTKPNFSIVTSAFEAFLGDYFAANPQTAIAMIEHVQAFAVKAEESEREYDRIKNLSDREHVRERPAMYIGDTTARGLQQLVYELVDNSIDEFNAGFASSIVVTIHADGAVSVLDDGPGLSPHNVHPDDVAEEMSNIEATMTLLRWGMGNSKKKYQTSGGIHGVGATVVNFLSERCEVEVYRKGQVYKQTYREGVPTSAVSVETVSNSEPKASGLKTTIKPDSKIFQTTDFAFDFLKRRFKQLAFINSRVRIKLSDERIGRTETYCHQDGIAAHVEDSTPDDAAKQNKIYQATGVEDGIKYELGLRHIDPTEENIIFSYACNIHTYEDGMHVRGVQRALWATLNEIGRATGAITDDIALSYEDYDGGLLAVVSVQLESPMFEGATKTRLANIETEAVLFSAASELFRQMFDDNQEIANEWIQRGIQRFHEPKEDD